MNLKQELNLQLFADAGTLVNASGNYVNAYSGETSAFPDGGGMTASMKTFYDRPPRLPRERRARPAGALHPHCAHRRRQDRGMAQVEHA